jgi:hypothetical protein
MIFSNPKISSLLNFLCKEGLFDEAFSFVKIAEDLSPEEYLKSNFPELFKIYENDNKPAPVYINIANQIGKKFNLSSEEEVNNFVLEKSLSSFEDLRLILKAKNKKEKESLFEGMVLTEEEKELVRNSGIKKDELLFVYNEDTRGNHTLSQGISDLKEIKENISYIQSFGEDIDIPNISSFTNLEEAYSYFENIKFDLSKRDDENVIKKLKRYYDYIYHGIVDPDHNYVGYDNVTPGIAKETSDIIGEVNGYTLVNSRSMEACQYWERGAVRVTEGSADFGTCTSRIGDPEGFGRNNFFEDYSSYIIIQFIKNFDENGDPGFKNSSSDPNDLVTAAFKNSFSHGRAGLFCIWGGSTTVNSKDVPVSKDDFMSVIGGRGNFNKAVDMIERHVFRTNIENVEDLEFNDFFNSYISYRHIMTEEKKDSLDDKLTSIARQAETLSGFDLNSIESKEINNSIHLCALDSEFSKRTEKPMFDNSNIAFETAYYYENYRANNGYGDNVDLRDSVREIKDAGWYLLNRVRLVHPKINKSHLCIALNNIFKIDRQNKIIKAIEEVIGLNALGGRYVAARFEIEKIKTFFERIEIQDLFGELDEEYVKNYKIFTKKLKKIEYKAKKAKTVSDFVSNKIYNFQTKNSLSAIEGNILTNINLRDNFYFKIMPDVFKIKASMFSELKTIIPSASTYKAADLLTREDKIIIIRKFIEYGSFSLEENKPYLDAFMNSVDYDIAAESGLVNVKEVGHLLHKFSNLKISC